MHTFLQIREPLQDLGFELPDSIKELAGDGSDFSVTLSRENVEALSDIDLMVVYGDEALLEALQKDELMSEIPAIKNGAVVLLDSTSRLAASTTPSILSIRSSDLRFLRSKIRGHSERLRGFCSKWCAGT